jgi:SAM-dependent methyltransferase
MSEVIWHDIECGGYAADLPLWRELARREAGPVLDVGAGAGRVTLELARQGHDVTALDRDAALLAELAARARAAGLAVRTELADAAGFELAGAPFGLIVVPMQTIQLLPGRAARAAFLASAREHLASGGLVALALSEVLEPFEVDPAAPLPPDRGERDGWHYLSFPVAIRPRGDVVVLERVRQAIAPDGSASTADDAIELASLSAPELEAEGAAAGLRAEPRAFIGETDAHLGSTVVMLRG